MRQDRVVFAVNGGIWQDGRRCRLLLYGCTDGRATGRDIRQISPKLGSYITKKEEA